MDTPPRLPHRDDRPETPTERERRIAHESVLIDEALASVAVGNTYSEAEVDAWLDSLGTDHELPRPGSRR